jgi:hypothetical protein
MKRFLGILAILLGLPIQSYAQKAIVYTTPQGNRVYYTSAVNATVDSVWSYLLANNTIAGSQVYSAVLLTARRVADLANGPYTGQVNFSRPASVLDPYKVAAVISGATVSSSLVNISLSSGVVTTKSATGIVGASTTAVDLCTVTVPASSWADGQKLILHVIFYGTFSALNTGNEYLRSIISLTGATSYTFDSSHGYVDQTNEMPYTLEFTRIGSAIWFTPSAAYLSAAYSGIGLNQASKASIANAYRSAFEYNSGYTNGTKFTGVDFTSPIVIKWNTKWVSAPDVSTTVKLAAAGCQVITLQ